MVFRCHGAVEKRRYPGGRGEAISYLKYICIANRKQASLAMGYILEVDGLPFYVA
jgi:hypothetical protein